MLKLIQHDERRLGNANEGCRRRADTVFVDSPNLEVYLTWLHGKDSVVFPHLGIVARAVLLTALANDNIAGLSELVTVDLNPKHLWLGVFIPSCCLL